MQRNIRPLFVTGISIMTLFVSLVGAPFADNAVAGAATPRCFSSSLTPMIGQSSGAAGTTYITLEIRNHSTSSCTLSGTPTALPGNVPKVGPHWISVGPPSSKLTFAGRGGNVIIRPGKIASVELGISTAGNYSPSTCGPKMVSGVEIIFSPTKSAVYLTYRLPRQAVCTKLASTSIAGIVLGTHFP